MKEFDYIIIGGGCAGLSLAYELEINDKLKEKTLAIIENREEYKRDKTWSFWKVFDHNFEDCVIKSWSNFTINTAENSNELTNKKFPYQSIDSGKFYKKINSKLSTNSNISFFRNLNEVNSDNSIIFNSIFEKELDKSDLWQHFQGIEIETPKNIFDDEIINLMDFNCDQRKDVHFFYTLPFSKNKALIETTWLSDLDDQSLRDYDLQLENYIKNNLGIKKYKINHKYVLGHSDISPDRKKDPGEKFPWRELAQNKLAWWHNLDLKKIKKFRKIKLSSKKEERSFTKNLYKLGYMKISQKRSKKNQLITKAFQRRFRQSLINGIVDKECLKISENLIKKIK